ncbi:putative enoyl-CoA hydratase echA12 [BD1-7 clade bacterium]|uniref:Putative enoyl-CoA hydratase echA12 n=1 Tax=BD1-7 clade bacterium TaxID=2029982 RepID=A0A5S9NND5_9GAMM|nr:putative enoyl-CoA hydratase echA12 [BD1-7 clade bacterium]CAA0094885.1 putative enoyl-CoA hydratase echA12 [BD1-7 clade bacterium]
MSIIPRLMLKNPYNHRKFDFLECSVSFITIENPTPDIAIVSLNRPERMNAMAFDVMVPFKEALETLSFDSSVRVVIITGVGEAFCSGADLEDPGYLPMFDGLTMPGIGRRAMRVLEDVITTIQNMHQPVIAAVNGPAIGGGFCLAMACDIRLAAQKAFFRPAGINNGLTAAELGLSYILPRAIGSTRAFEIMLTGRDVDSKEASDIGLVSNVVADESLMDECLLIAKRITGFSQVGVELTKQMIWSGLESNSKHSHMNHEGQAQLFVRMTTSNFEEAIRARKQKRAPEFKDE